MIDYARNWLMVGLALIFVSLYSAVLMGWLRPFSDRCMATKLEPLMFLIIGYFLGRLPAQQHEKTLRDEVTHHALRAEAAQQAKERAQQSRDAIEERLKNVRSALITGSDATIESTASKSDLQFEERTRQSVRAALSILNS